MRDLIGVLALATAGLSKEEKDKILKALEKDREFRYAVMGLLGFKELLERFSRLEEHQQRLEERQQKLEERFAELEKYFARLEERQQRLEERQQRLEELFARLEERQQKLEEHFARLEERQQRLEERFAELEKHFARLEEHQQRLEERQQKLEEHFARLEERQQRLEERQQRLEEEMAETRRTLLVIAHRFGVISESSFREGMKHIVERVLGAAKVERWIYNDTEGLVYGHPSVVEVDVVVKDNKHILVEVKSRVSKGDVAEISKIGKLYEKVTGVKPELVVIGGFIDHNVYDLAKSLGVVIVPVISEEGI